MYPQQQNDNQPNGLHFVLGATPICGANHDYDHRNSFNHNIP